MSRGTAITIVDRRSPVSRNSPWAVTQECGRAISRVRLLTVNMSTHHMDEATQVNIVFISQSKSHRACRTGEEDGCSTKQRLSATPASNDDQSVVKGKKGQIVFLKTHNKLKLERPAGAPYLGVEIPISSTMPTLLGRAPFLLVPLKLQPSKLPRDSIRHVGQAFCRSRSRRYSQ